MLARGDQLKTIFDPDTYAGTVSSPTLRLLLAVAAEDDLDLVSNDIKFAFLYSSLKPEELIFLKRPSGASDDIMPHVVQLVKCLYGLPQASKYFDDHLSSTLLSIGFTRYVADSEVFILRCGDEKVILVKHVDDCLLAATKGSSLLDFVSKSLSKVYTLTTSIEPTNFVGLAITRDRPKKSLTITQPNYVVTLIDRFSVPTSSAKYPMSEDYLTGMSSHADDILLTPLFQTLFQEKVGSILYLASLSRPDLLYTTTQLTRRSNKTKGSRYGCC